MKKIILTFLILTSGLAISQIKKDLKHYKVIDSLNKYGIKFKDYVLYDEFEIKNYNEGYTISNNKDSISLKKISIFDKKEIFLYTYQFTPTDYKHNHNEYFKINGRNFLIDSIVCKSKIDLRYSNPYFYFRKSYLFKEKKKNLNMLIVEAENRTFYRDKFVKSYFIIKIDKNKIEMYLFYDLDKSKVLVPL